MSRRRARSDRRPALSRREMLRLLSASTLIAPFDPIRALIEGLADGFIRKVMADETGGTAPRNLVHIGLFGAPPRYYWDLPLSPYGSGSFDPSNAHVVTRFKDDGTSANSDAEYATTPITVGTQTLHMPWIWGQNIPLSDGSSWKQMGEALAPNMAVIRGIRQNGDGHEFLSYKPLQPDSAAGSLHGLVADASSAYVPAVGITTSSSFDISGGYRAPNGTALTKAVVRANPLTTILEPFQRQTTNGFNSGTLLTRRQALDSAMTQALDVLAVYAKSAQPGSDALHSARGKAEAFIAAGLGDITTDFTTLKSKYATLISRCMNWSGDSTSRMTGITDKRISVDPAYSSYNRSSVSAGAIFSSTSTAYDLRSLIASTSGAYGMDEFFAVAEYLIKHGYSSTVFTSFGGVHGIDTSTLSAIATTIDGAAKTFTDAFHRFDEHAAAGGGRHGSLLVCSQFFRSLSACIYELSQSLGSSIFENTVIHVGSEFSRLPNNTGIGSEHAPYTCVSSVFSGAIQAPVVVGNTAPYNYSVFTGSFGTGGLTNVNGAQTHLVAGHLASTLAQLLRVETPTPNNPSLLNEDGTAAFEAAKEVDE